MDPTSINSNKSLAILIKLYFKKSKLNQQSKLYQQLGVDPSDLTYLDALFDSKANKDNVSHFFSDAFNKHLFARFLIEENFLLLTVLGLDG